MNKIQIKKESKCRLCNNTLQHIFADFGMMPLANANLDRKDLGKKEKLYPLTVYVCDQCFLVQLAPEYRREEMFTKDYPYFSSYSETWLQHAKSYVEMAVNRFNLDKNSFVVEVASNDGYLLQYFAQKGIPILGIEPCHNVAEAARRIGIPTREDFFGVKTAVSLVKEGKLADLVVANNVLAHVPDIHDFVEGIRLLLKPEGVITMEFQYLLRLMEQSQFDTIYHEHYSYFSFLAVERLFKEHGLKVIDVEELPTHGGSLRVYAVPTDSEIEINNRVHALREVEKVYRVNQISTYLDFTKRAEKVREELHRFFEKAEVEGKTIAGYGAPAKGSTLLHYCGITVDELPYTVDRSPSKQGLYLPVTHIPIFSPEKIRETKPDYILILPWNIKEEIMKDLDYIREWDGKFVTAIPKVKIFL